MAGNYKQVAKTFLEAWTPEFVKSVEMFTGQAVTVEPGEEAETEKTLASERSILWHGQVFEREGTGSVWIGTPVAACRALTGTSAEDAASGDALYLELLKQSFEGAAHLLSAGRTPRIVCKQDLESNTLPSSLAYLKSAWLAGTGQERSPILLGFESAFADLLSAEEPPPMETPRATHDALQQSTRLLERLVDLELPISVVLGRAKMPIRDVLKLTAGSLVELDRRAGELVEIVVHNAVVARGEVVSISGNYGVRIREIISRSDRFALQATASPRPPRATLKPMVN
jgi:flagellar motor switch protein FliN/FliY